MLVLTRKMNEQILIGNDIKITLVRVRGNSVRIGIEAPREVRVVRGELNVHDDTSCEDLQLSEREQAFAHPLPQRNVVKQSAVKAKSNKVVAKASGTNSRLDVFPPTSRPSIDSGVPASDTRQIFVGRVDRNGENGELRRAPLARFMSAQ